MNDRVIYNLVEFIYQKSILANFGSIDPKIEFFPEMHKHKIMQMAYLFLGGLLVFPLFFIHSLSENDRENIFRFQKKPNF